MRKLKALILFCFMVAMLAPFSSLAADQTTGTVIVSVSDEDGGTLGGNWYLHRGTTASGYLVRNGSAGESVQMDSGYYYLELRGLPQTYPYYYLHSTNPQLLSEGGSITFNVQYFKTQDEMLTASGNPPATQVAESATATEQANDVIDQHGCNSTQGYAWCAKDEVCVRFWSPACRVTTTETAVEPVVAEKPVTVPVPAVVRAVNLRSSNVPTFETAPVASVEPENLNVTIEASEGMRLVQTGSFTGLLLIASMLLSLGISRRFCTRRQRP